MKNSGKLILAAALMIFITMAAGAQNQTDTTSVQHKVIKQNGIAFVGKILSQDAREILMETNDIGLVYIPKHEVKEIIQIQQGEKPITGGLFATRYFLTTNGFSIKKGDNYVQWNLFGPDFQFGVVDNFSMGIMTSWVGMPVIGTTKYSHQIADGIYGGIGFLGGTGSWAYPEYGLLLPYGFLTLGNRMNNINVSAGYGALFMERSEMIYTIQNTPTEWSTNSYTMTDNTHNDSEGRMLMSVAGMFRINSKFSFVFDSFIMLPGKEETYKILKEDYSDISKKVTYSLATETRNNKPLIVLAPGLRFQATENSSFQFGFTGLHLDGEFVPVPIPMVQWFRRI
ncbi:MAG: hypothetical protein A2X22_07080 [Bacteroidetes bacterium GWF2_49_14]|nr:MAG: hypothetical protein A2X22_07080 [Bacteroidetes bacterium GWF2_49_14]HBB90955.1 hypothetical protein [Bacteroidales bacterium]